MQERTSRFPVALGLAIALAAGLVAARPAAAQIQRVDGYSATLTNVGGLEGTPIRIDLVRWSSDEDRADLIDAIEGYAEGLVELEAWREARAAEEAAAAAAAEAEEAEEAEAAEAEEDEAEEEEEEEEEPEPEPDPLGDFIAAMREIPTAGVLWADTSSGYTIKGAFNEALPDGGERVVLVTSTPLGEHRFGGWQTAEGPEEYIYSVVEFRIPASGAGEGKSSLSAGVALDADASTIGLADYDAAPVHFADVELAPAN